MKIILTFLVLTMAIRSGCYGLTDESFLSQLEKAVKSLSNLLDYMSEPRSVVGDMIFGIVMARGQLVVMKKHLLQKPPTERNSADISVLSFLENKCTEIYKKYVPIRVQKNTTEDNLIMNYIIQEDLWEVNYPIVNGRLKEHAKGKLSRGNFWKPHKLNIEETLHLLLTGTPNEQQSDECISQLVDPEWCGTNSNCLYLMTNQDYEIHGYPLTHRLLYFQTARQLGCENNVEFTGLQDSISKLCSDILVDQYHIIDLGIPQDLRDLFMEQSILCGMEGYAEFLNPSFIDLIFTLQNSRGCFGRKSVSSLDEMEPHTRAKRDDGQLEDNCEMHITGLAASYLAIIIRAIVEYWNPNISISFVYGL